mgnify:CR=1 FL=1
MYETELRCALRECQFTSEIGEEHLEELAAVASWVRYPGGTVIFREGSLSSEIYLIIDGSVSLEKLWPPPKLGESSCPRLELRQSKLTLQGAAGSRPLEFNLDEALVLKHVDAMPAVSSNATGIS